MLGIFRIVKRKRKARKSRSASNTAKYLNQKEITRRLILERLVHYKNIYRDIGHELNYKGVAIRDQKTRWGSCTSLSNLNFNYRLGNLPIHLVDYVVAHELCHLKYMNHGKEFWSLLSLSIPEYKSHKNELKSIRMTSL